MRQKCIFGHIWARIWARQIWSSGVFLKRPCKMLFRRVGPRSIGPSSQKLWPNQIFGRSPHCNYNVKLQSGGHSRFMGLLYNAENFCVSFFNQVTSIFHLWGRKIKKKFFFGPTYWTLILLLEISRRNFDSRLMQPSDLHHFLLRQ